MIRTEVAKAFGWAARRLWPRAPIILIYHRIADPRRDVWGITTSPERFAEQIEALKSVRQVVSLTALVEASGRGDDTRLPLAAITFDDGYQDVFANARPILQRLDAQATVFVVSGLVDQARAFWWDELAGLFLGDRPLPRSLELEVRGRPHRWQLPADDPGAPRLVCHLVRRALRNETPDEIERQLAALRTWAGAAGPAARDDNRLMTSAEIAALRDGPLEVGAHTIRHPRLPTLDGEAQFAEIDGSRRRLREIAGAEVRHFAYPFGDYDGRSIAAARRAGFASACAASPGAVLRPGGRFALPRIAPDDADGETLLRALA